MTDRARVTNVPAAQETGRGEVATHFRCAAHDLTLPLGEYGRHIGTAHDGVPTTITPLWSDA